LLARRLLPASGAALRRFLAAHGDADAAQAIVEAERREISLDERYKGCFGYGYYIARKVTDNKSMTCLCHA
jgi:hypothetical protein